MNYVLFNHVSTSHAILGHSDKETAEKTAHDWNERTGQEWTVYDFKEFQELCDEPARQSLRR